MAIHKNIEGAWSAYNQHRLCFLKLTSYYANYGDIVMTLGPGLPINIKIIIASCPYCGYKNICTL